MDLSVEIAPPGVGALPYTPAIAAHKPRGSARLQFLDALRGGAALVVFLQHAGEHLWPAFGEVTGNYFDLGRCGVMVFFLCSGFIIPLSLERYEALGPFWIGRFFRLYPLYWCSLAAALLLSAAHRFALPQAFSARPGVAIAANVTMLQALVGMPGALLQYWTLFFELIFYLFVSALFAIRAHRATVFVAVCLLLASAGIGVALPPLAGLASAPDLLELVFIPATMFIGTVVYRLYEGAVAACVAFGLMGVAALIVGGTLAAHHLAHVPLGPGAVPILSASLVAYAVFALAFLGRDRTPHPVILYTGKISYSLYLIHPLIIAALPPLGGPIVTFALWSAALAIMAAVSYRWLEVPCIAFSRRLTAARAVRPRR